MTKLDDDEWGDTTCVYVVSMGNMVKIGITRDPWERLSKLQTSCPEPLKLRRIDFLPTRATAVLSEKRVHKRLAHRRVRGEWFLIDHEDAVETVRKVIDRALYGNGPRPTSREFESVEAMMAWADAVNARAPLEA